MSFEGKGFTGTDAKIWGGSDAPPAPPQFRRPGECWYCQWSRLKERISLMRIDGWLRRQCSVVRRRPSGATVAAARAEKRRTKKTSKTRTRSANGFLFCLKSGPKKSFLCQSTFQLQRSPASGIHLWREHRSLSFLTWAKLKTNGVCQTIVSSFPPLNNGGKLFLNYLVFEFLNPIRDSFHLCQNEESGKICEIARLERFDKGFDPIESLQTGLGYHHDVFCCP